MEFAHLGDGGDAMMEPRTKFGHRDLLRCQEPPPGGVAGTTQRENGDQGKDQVAAPSVPRIRFLLGDRVSGCVHDGARGRRA